MASGESDYALPNAHGYDKMENVFLYHLNALTYGLPDWFPQMSADQKQFFVDSTIGVLEGNAGEEAVEVLTMEDMTTADLANLDQVTAQKGVAELERLAALDAPFFMSVNFAANHQPNLPSPDFVNASDVKNKYGDKVVELDSVTGMFLDKVKELGIEENTLIVYTVDNGAWQDVHPDSGMTPFRGTKGTDREGGWRVPAFFKWTGKIEPGSKSTDIVGGTDLMATFANLAGVDLPTKDREDQPMIFDSIDMAPVLFARVNLSATSGPISLKMSCRRARSEWVRGKPCSTFEATTAHAPGPKLRLLNLGGVGPRNTWRPFRRCSTCGKILWNVMISS